MTRRSICGSVAPLAAVASAALGGAAISAATALGRTAHRAATPTIHVVEHAVTDTEIPLVPGGSDEKGDVLTFVNPLFNAANRRRVGHDEGFCTRLSVMPGIYECLWTNFLRAGQITVQGPFYDTRNSVLSVTGGTGRYAGARGQMRLLSRDGGKAYDFIFHLR